MPRDEGFTHADLATNALHHPRLRKLRAEHGEAEGAVLTTIWLELVLASWLDGDRLTLDEIESPATVTDERLEALKAAGLVDAQYRVPAKAWAAWYAPARDRRETARTNGRKGARSRWAKGAANGAANSVGNGAGNSETMPTLMPDRQTDSARSTSALSSDEDRAPARQPTRPTSRPQGAPSRSAAVASYCTDPSTHRPDYQWIGDAWRCMPCEQTRAAADPLTFREKVAKAATAPEDERSIW